MPGGADKQRLVRNLLIVALAAGLLCCIARAWAQPPAAQAPQPISVVAVFPLQPADEGQQISLEVPEKVWRAALERVSEAEEGVSFLLVTADSPVVRRAVEERRLTRSELEGQITGEQARRIATQLEAQVALVPRVALAAQAQDRVEVAVTLMTTGGTAASEVPGFALTDLTGGWDQAWLDSHAADLAARVRERVCPAVRDLVLRSVAAEDTASQGLYSRAQQAYEAANFEEAASLLREAMSGKQPRPEYHLLLAEVYYREGKIEAAAAQFKAAARLAPNPLAAKRRYGECLAQLGQVAEATAEFESVVKSAPEDREAIVALARLYLREERSAEAAVLLKKALDLDPGNADLALQLASAYARINRAEEALRIYQQLGAQGNGGSDLLERMAELQAQRKEYVAAFEYYAQAAKNWGATKYLNAKQVEQLGEILDRVVVAALEDAREALIGFSCGETMRENAFAVLVSRRTRLGNAVGLLDKIRVPPSYEALIGVCRQAVSLAYQALTDQVLFVDLNQPRYNTTGSSLFEQAGKEVVRARQMLESLTRTSGTP